MDGAYLWPLICVFVQIVPLSDIWAGSLFLFFFYVNRRFTLFTCKMIHGGSMQHRMGAHIGLGLSLSLQIDTVIVHLLAVSQLAHIHAPQLMTAFQRLLLQ